MKYITSKKYVLFSLGMLVSFMLFFVSVVHATTPTLSVVPSGDGDTVQLNVTGDQNASVLFFYTKVGVGQQIVSIGTTNSNGTLSTSISSSSYGVASGSTVYITTSGINGPQSPTITWPSVSSMTSSSNMLSLSQTGLVLQIGQSSTITASNMNSSSLYLSSNSSPMIAGVNLSGSQITVLGNSYGTTVATICLVSNSSNCGSIYVTVQNSSASPLTFSQNSVSLYSGQSISVSVSGGSGSYLVLNNANQNNAVVQATISGSNVMLTTTSTTGSSSITVCSTNMTSCGIINVTIGSGSSSAVSFSQSNPTVVIGQTTSVSIYGPQSSLFYVSSNSNPGIVQANLSGTTLSLLGITNGSSVINVCASTSNCASLNVTVNYNSSSTGGFPTLSQDNVSLAVGQTLSITISGGSMPYNILSTVNNIFQPTLNVNMLTIYGLSAGSGAMNVCSNGGSCATLSVTVGGTGSTSTLPAGCYTTAGYSQTTGMPCNTVSTTTSFPAGCYTTSGYSQTTGMPCSTISPVVPVIPVGCLSTTPFSTVNGQSCPNYVYTPPVTTTTPVVTTTTPPTTTVSTPPMFTLPLKLGSTGTEVVNLQKKLKTLGFYTGKIDGGFGAATEKAVKAFQKAHKLSQLGSVGPGTRALLNK